MGVYRAFNFDTVLISLGSCCQADANRIAHITQLHGSREEYLF